MKVGIDFDNTIVCYDDVFASVAKEKGVVPPDFSGNKQALRDTVRKLPDGEKKWMALQGKVYGEFISRARMFDGVKEFIAALSQQPNTQVFIVSHKTEFGHFDEKKISLRDAARNWLTENKLLSHDQAMVPESHLFFETTRDEKIARINQIGCTHFIDDLEEVLYADNFPPEVKKYLFKPGLTNNQKTDCYQHWKDIRNAILG